MKTFNNEASKKEADARCLVGLTALLYLVLDYVWFSSLATLIEVFLSTGITKRSDL